MSIDLILATTGRAVTRATRTGENWEVDSVLDGMQVNMLVASPHDAAVIFAATQQNGLQRSTDRGLTWNSVGLDGHPIKALALHPHDSSILYAGVKPAGIWKSTDGGQTWFELEGFRRIPSRRLWFSPAEAPGTAYVQGLVVPAADPDVVVAGIEFGAVVRSTDGGQTWKDHRKGALRDCHSLIGHPTAGAMMYEGGGTGAGASISRDAGASWTQLRKGADRHYGWSVAADPANPEIWYASLSPGPNKAHSTGQAEAYIYRNEGKGTWVPLSGGLPQPLPEMPYALRTDPDTPGHLYAGLANGDVWHTEDYGDSWVQMPLNLKSVHRDMIIL